eukprot:3180095-Rhodomonas_salina.1
MDVQRQTTTGDEGAGDCLPARHGIPLSGSDKHHHAGYFDSGSHQRDAQDRLLILTTLDATAVHGS